MGIDPVGVDENNVHSHNRYAYANNNPYRFVDPTGNIAETALDVVSLGLSIAQYNQDPSILNGIGLAYDVVGTAVPILPAGFGIVRSAGKAGASGVEAAVAAKKVTNNLPDSALVCRGGQCTAENFAKAAEKGVSVNSGAGKTIEELTKTIPNKQVGVTTVGDVRRAGGNVVPSPTASNPNHCDLCGLTPKVSERLFNPTVRNPNVK